MGRLWSSQWVAVSLRLFPILLLSPSLPSSAQDYPKKIRRLNESAVKAFERLAKSYDQKKDPEAAHFFASCALGFGSKDSKVVSIKGGWEIDVFIGKARGGKVLTRTGPIQGDMRRLANEYSKAITPFLKEVNNRSISEGDATALRDLLIRYELTRGAASYVKAIQRINELRRGVGLRAVLWNFETSSRLILACWYMTETGDCRTTSESDTRSFFYSPAVETAKNTCSLLPMHSVLELPDSIRTLVRVRQDLLNIDSRWLHLAGWEGGQKLRRISVYSFPSLPARNEIPTPSERYANKTVVQDIDGWADTEHTITVNGRTVPYVIYPHQDERDVLPYFSNGRGGHETGWSKSEYDLLEKAGMPIMLRFFGDYPLSDVRTTLSVSSEKELPTRVYTNAGDRIKLPKTLSTIVLLPEEHLPSGSTITVSVKCLIGDSPFQKSWSFRTAK